MPAGDISMSVPVNFTDNAADAHRSLMPDPLVLELCMDTGPPAWFDPMLEELVTLLVAR